MFVSASMPSIPQNSYLLNNCLTPSPINQLEAASPQYHAPSPFSPSDLAHRESMDSSHQGVPSCPPSPFDLVTFGETHVLSSGIKSHRTSPHTPSSNSDYTPESPARLNDFPQIFSSNDRHSPLDLFPNLRASPSPGKQMSDEESTKYALDIWHARYSGLWVPSIFPPTYIDVPTTILNEVCSKAVDTNTMTFAHFTELMENPNDILRTYSARGNLSPLHFSSSPSQTDAPMDPERHYQRPAFWPSAIEDPDLAHSGREAVQREDEDDLDSEVSGFTLWPRLLLVRKQSSIG